MKMDKKRTNDNNEILGAEETTRLQIELQESNKNENVTTYTAPDGGYGWVVVAASFICNCIVDGIVYSFGSFLESYMNHFNVDKGTMTLAGSLLSGIYMCVGPIVSALANKYGCRTVTIAGSFVGAFAFTLSTIAPSYVTFLLVYGVLGGLGFGMIYLPAVVFVGYYFEKKRSLATGIAVCGSGFGAFIFAPISKFLLENFDSWKSANLVFACIILLCIICGGLMKPLEFENATEAEMKALNADPGVQASNPHLDKIAQSPNLPTIVETKATERPLNRSLMELRNENPQRDRLNSEPDVGQHLRLRKPSSDGDKTVPVLIRKDIFYSGSIQNLKEYQSQKSLQAYKSSNASLNKDRRRSSGYIAARTIEEVEASEESCQCLPPSIRSTLNSLVDFSLIKDPVFMLLAVSNLFGMAALFVPFFYMPDEAKNNGVEQWSQLVSIIGLTNIFGRIGFGFVADFPWVNSLLLNNICLLLSAFSVAAISTCTTFPAYATVSVVFGLGLAGYMSLTSIILVDLLGLDKLTNAFGLLILFRGTAAIFGAPLIGMASESTGISAFIIAGILFGISALFSFMAPVAVRYRKSKN